MDGRQKLLEFIAASTTQSKFARDIDCSESHLSLVLAGERGVSLELAKKIEDATAGTVPAGSLVRTPAAEAAE